MKTHVDDNSVEAKAANTWYQTAVNSAVVAGVFALIVLALLVVNYVQIKVVDPVRAEKLEIMKLKLADQLDNQELLTKIRETDLQIRRDKIQRLAFAHRGGWLLLGSLAVFLIAVKYAVSCRKRLPAPQAPSGAGDEQVRQATFARWAVTAGLVVFSSLAAFLATRSKIDFDVAGALSAPYPSIEEIRKNWPGFRGPGGLGISAYTNIPSSWDGNTGRSIAWKTAVPLEGKNSPIVWGDRVFVSGADENVRQVYCFDAHSGEHLWTGDVPNRAPAGTEPLESPDDTGLAASTMTTDGRRVYAIFATGDIGCFDFEGNEIWSKNLGPPDSTYGYASSLAMYRNRVLIQYDQGAAEDKKSRLIALDGFSGRTVWETKRPVPNSWTSPIIADSESGLQLITCGDPYVIAYDPNNGAELWRAECLGTDVAPSPIFADGFVFAIEPYTELVAIRPDGRGNVTDTHIAWVAEGEIPDICSPLSNGPLIWLLTTEGTLTCYQTKDRAKVYQHDFEDGFYASPSLVRSRLYLLTEKGAMIIIEAGREYKELARCELGENCYASPAFADGRIYIRGENNLYCIGNTN